MWFSNDTNNTYVFEILDVPQMKICGLGVETTIMKILVILKLQKI